MLIFHRIPACPPLSPFDNLSFPCCSLATYKVDRCTFFTACTDLQFCFWMGPARLKSITWFVSHICTPPVLSVPHLPPPTSLCSLVAHFPFLVSYPWSQRKGGGEKPNIKVANCSGFCIALGWSNREFMRGKEGNRGKGMCVAQCNCWFDWYRSNEHANG